VTLASARFSFGLWCASGSAPRIVNTFNNEAEAREWLNKQRHVDWFIRRMARNPDGHGAPD
jgi:hypothetical protein